MKNRSYSMTSTHQNCEFCSESLFSSSSSAGPQRVSQSQQLQFYLFPCSHGFHTKCLLQRAKSHLLLEPSQLSAGMIIDYYCYDIIAHSWGRTIFWNNFYHTKIMNEVDESARTFQWNSLFCRQEKLIFVFSKSYNCRDILIIA